MSEFRSLYEASRLLRENQSLLDPEKNKIAHNLSTALLHMCGAMERLSEDVERMNSRLQPILREIADDYADARRITGKDR